MRKPHGRLRAPAILAAICAALLATVTACSSSGTSSAPPSSPAATSQAAAPAANVANLTAMSPAQALAAAYKGTFGTPPTSGPKAVTGKSVWVVSCGQAAYSCSIPAGYAMDAVAAIGWKGHLCDGQLDPSVETTCVQQAIAAGANGILLAGIDCSGLVSSLEAAKTAGVKVVSPLGFDCNDPHVGGSPLFSAYLTYSGGQDLKTYITNWGASRAAWIIGNSGGHAQVIDVTLDGVLVPTYADQGFEEMMAKCAGCKIVDTVHLSLSDVASGAASQKVATALESFPKATYLDSPFDSAIPAFIAGAIKDSGRKNLKVMGDECFSTNLTYIRTGGPENACSALAEDWGEWAAVDTLNRLFAGDSAASMPDSGLGFQLVDPAHNLPASGPYVAPVNFKAAYEKVWGT